jgi:hypothetical protein
MAGYGFHGDGFFPKRDVRAWLRHGPGNQENGG